MKLISKIKPIWLISILAFILALVLNNANLKSLPQENIRHGQTVITNDDVSYLNPPFNYLKTGEWKDNILGNQAYFNRPPGYGIIYLAALSVTSSQSEALMALKIIQLLLFALSLIWLFAITLSLFKEKKVA